MAIDTNGGPPERGRHEIDTPGDEARPDARSRRIATCGPAAIGFRLEAAAAATAIEHDPGPFPLRLPGTSRLPVATGFELDLAAHELRHAGRPIHLRPREFELLATLAAAPGRAFTRRQLVDLAWSPGRAVDLRTVDVHVHWLRSKIEPHPARPTHLLTIRGFGYRLDPHPR